MKISVQRNKWVKEKNENWLMKENLKKKFGFKKKINEKSALLRPITPSQEDGNETYDDCNKLIFVIRA
jgi:hypothetical protein